MISSAVVFNQQRAFDVSQKVIPLLKTESVLVNNLIDAAANRLTGNERIQTMAKDLLTTIKEKCDPAIVLPLVTNKVVKNSIGRAFVLSIVVDLCAELQDKRPNYVVK